MLKSTAISDAGLTKQTLYEVERNNFNSVTYDRAIECMDAVNFEFQGLIYTDGVGRDDVDRRQNHGFHQSFHDAGRGARMALKYPFAKVMNDNRPDNAVVLDHTVKGALRLIISTTDELAAGAHKLLEGEIIVELDPQSVDVSFVWHRLEDDKQAFEDLLGVISKQGQNSPILVGPHPGDNGRYMVVFGYRCLKVAKALGQKVRAVMKTITDRDHVIT